MLGACSDATAPSAAITATCDAPGTVTANGEQIPVAPNGYATVGNQIISAETCKPFRFLGMSRPSLSFSADGGRLAVDTATAADFARIRSWGANSVRIELAQYYWVSGSRYYDSGYAARVTRVVQQARQAGLRVILALQYSDRGDPTYLAGPAEDMHQPMPDVAHSVPFWTDVATRFKGDGGVVFELFGEPYPVDPQGSFRNWDLWLKGGSHPADRVYVPRAPFEAVGMQALYDAVRGTGANNLVLISGTNWGYYLDGVPAHRVKGYNLAYAAHPWDWPDKQPGTWDKDWAFLAATDPVVITEFGNYDCREGYIRSVMDKADELHLSWVAWAWMAPASGVSTAQTAKGDPICDFPMLITDWGGTPSKIGKLVKDRLASY